MIQNSCLCLTWQKLYIDGLLPVTDHQLFPSCPLFLMYFFPRNCHAWISFPLHSYAFCRVFPFIFYTTHCWYIEPRNREKNLRLIWQRFSCLLDEWIAKISKKMSDDHVTVFSLLGDVIHQQAENKQILVLRPF